jgi:hypothetical protein
MGFALAPLAFTALAASHPGPAQAAHPGPDSVECQQIRSVAKMAKQHGLERDSIRELKRIYCKQRRRPRHQQQREAMFRQQCDELQTLEWLASVDNRKMSKRIARYREETCEGYTLAPRTWGNGRLARTSSGTWYYPNGKLAMTSSGTLYWPSGKLAKTTSDTWYYPNGRLAHSSSGNWAQERDLVRNACRRRDECREEWRYLRDLPEDARDARVLQLAWVSRG